VPLQVKGCCLDLEKGYFRLNTAPDPAKIRPVATLRKSLKHVKKRWKTEGVHSLPSDYVLCKRRMSHAESLFLLAGDYKWFCDQMKGIRQDLQLQCIRDEFTVEVCVDSPLPP
jgi:hypothetical protein